MIKKIIYCLVLLMGLQVCGQNLIYTGNGNIRDEQNNKLTPTEVRHLLQASNPDLLYHYNKGRSKKTAGNILLAGGLSLMAADLLIALNSTAEYPGALTYVGGLAVAIAIPVKIGFSNRIRYTVNEYNKGPKTGSLQIDNLGIIADRNGLGLRLEF